MTRIGRLLEAAEREVTLPECGWQFKIVRANTYQFMRTKAPPMGTLIQGLSGAAWKIAQGEKISDEEACEINASAPGEIDYYEALLIECVREMKVGDDPWELVTIVPDNEEADHDKDEIAVADFVRALDPNDLGVLSTAIAELNGLGKVVAALLAPFRGRAGGPAGPDGEEVRDAPDGAPEEAGPAGVPDQPGGDDPGDERGAGGGEAGNREGKVH